MRLSTDSCAEPTSENPACWMAFSISRPVTILSSNATSAFNVVRNFGGSAGIGTLSKIPDELLPYRPTATLEQAVAM